MSTTAARPSYPPAQVDAPPAAQKGANEGRPSLSQRLQSLPAVSGHGSHAPSTMASSHGSQPAPRQRASTGDMIFGVPSLVEAVSRVHTLEAGDLLLTGTPAGVGAVGPGDVITAGIEELGVEIRVPIIAAHDA